MLGLTVRLPLTFDDIASILHSSTKLSDGCGHNDHDDLTYFQSFGYLQTIAFTIGYGHITPICHGGKVQIQSLDKSALVHKNIIFVSGLLILFCISHHSLGDLYHNLVWKNGNDRNAVSI